MSKRKLSIKEKEEKEQEKEEIRSAAKKLKLEREELENKKKEEKQMRLDAIQQEKDSALPATDWSIIPDVDWENINLSPFQKNFLKESTATSQFKDAHNATVSIVRGPNKGDNLSDQMHCISSLKSHLLPQVLLQFLIFNNPKIISSFLMI